MEKSSKFIEYKFDSEPAYGNTDNYIGAKIKKLIM